MADEVLELCKKVIDGRSAEEKLRILLAGKPIVGLQQPVVPYKARSFRRSEQHTLTIRERVWQEIQKFEKNAEFSTLQLYAAFPRVVPSSIVSALKQLIHSRKITRLRIGWYRKL